MGVAQEKDIRALDELYNRVGVYRKAGELNELFSFVRKFPKLAPFNAFLLHIQKPGSQYVATAEQWMKAFERRVKPGARPLVILWPFAPVEFVFELEDTEGDSPFPEELLRPFKTEGRLSPRRFARLVGNLPRDGVAYQEADHGTGSAGFISVEEFYREQSFGKHRVEVLYNLVVNANLSLEEKFATVAHELGHLYCGHLGRWDDTCWPDRRWVKAHCAEFEAESVAWLVCERAGIANPSERYLAPYLDKDLETPVISLDGVLKAAGIIESMLERTLGVRKELVAGNGRTRRNPRRSQRPS